MSGLAEAIVQKLWDKSPSGIVPSLARIRMVLETTGRFTIPIIARKDWSAASSRICVRSYSRERDYRRALKRNDLRFARALDALRGDKK